MTLATGTCSRERQAHSQNRAHFFGVAANLMSQIMADRPVYCVLGEGEAS
jgi:hypothetical protein